MFTPNERPACRKMVKTLMQRHKCNVRDLLDLHNLKTIHLSRGTYLQSLRMYREEHGKQYTFIFRQEEQ